MTTTANLSLPYLASGQAQKHVTHNEALRMLDALVMLTVLDRDLSAPPPAPADGARYLVAAPGSGAFAGHDNQIAHHADGGWLFHAPQAGWTCFVADESTLLAYDGAAWVPAVDALGGVSELHNLTRLGIGAAADGTNPFAAKLNSALWTARTGAEGGDGDLRYRLNKEAAANTLSLLMQSGFSGRAEIGLTGDDDFHFKVSPDGTAWHDAILIDKDSGAVSFPHTTLQGGRELLGAHRTYYVRTDGADSNDGLANNSGGAFLTIQKAIDVVAALDISIYNVTIQVADGNYTSGGIVSGPFVGSGSVTIRGNVLTPANCAFTVNNAACLLVKNGAVVNLAGFKFVTTGSAVSSLHVTDFGVCNVNGLMEYGAAATIQIYAERFSNIQITANYTLSGSAIIGVGAQESSRVSHAGSLTVTVAGAASYGGGTFARAQRISFLGFGGLTFSGLATGPRYVVNTNSVIDTAGGGASFLPGNSGGSSATGGQYL